MPLEIGFAKVDITPESPAPLAGYVTKKERIFDRIRDRVHARALFLRNHESSACIVSIDLLTIHRELRNAVQAEVERQGLAIDFLLHCTHTHSSIGGYWDAAAAKKFCGAYSKELFDHLTKKLAQAVVESAKDLRPASFASASIDLPGFNENRRDMAGGPLDPEMIVCEFKFAGGKAALVNYAGHPVIAAEKDFMALSADYPGALCAKLEEEYDFAIYVNGGVGGTSIIFPPGIRDCGEHLEFVAEGLLQGAQKAIAKLKPRDFNSNPVIATQVVAHEFPADPIRAFPGSWKAINFLARPISSYLERYLKDAKATGPVRLHNVRIGKLALVGQPTDAGVGLALEIKRAAKQAGFDRCIVASHCDEYSGYMHMPADYAFPFYKNEDKFMVIYENIMSLLGPGAGAVMLSKETEMLKELADR